jgi:WS/DGAT/MGAT family acyltransferase
MTRRLSSIDWAFLQTETATNLAHVAGLWIFKLPKAYRKNFWREYINGLNNPEQATPPFNYKVSGGFDLPRWVEDPDFDLDNHIRFASLPRPGSTDQLVKMVSRIHSHMLDRSQPLWECYLIEGVSGRRVAIYFKVHHALLDGVSTLEYMLGSFLSSPDAQASRAFWQPPVNKKSQDQSTGLLKRLGRASSEMLNQVRTLPELSATVAKEGLQILNLVESPTKAPFTSPKSPLGKSISSKRSLAVKGFSLSRIKKLGKASGSTVNDIVLAMSAGALRDFLGESGGLPEKSLTAWVPVSVRTGEEGQAGNRVSVMVCSLATDVADAGERLEAIRASIQVAKSQLKGQSTRTTDNYTMLLSSLLVLTQKMGLAERIAPVANVVISNVAGSRDYLYLNGATLVEQYPISMVIDGQALNITVTSHDDRLDFGLLACPGAVPDLQTLAENLETALEEIEKTSSGIDSKRTTDMNDRKSTTKTKKSRGMLGNLITSLGAIPIETLNMVIAGEKLSKKAINELQSSLNKMSESANSLVSNAKESADSKREELNGPDPELMSAQAPLWNTLMDYYFRLEVDGWDRFPDQPGLFIGIHSGGPLTMDAWTVALAWWRHFEGERTIHGTAHDVLMSSPGLGRYFRRMGTITPSRENIAAAFAKGDDVILWPGGEVDAYRSWDKRDKAILGGRKGFVRLAIREQVPIVPIATVGGHDALFVLSEGRGLAKKLKLKERMRSEVAPITLSIPFGVTLHLTPFQHVPLPTKIRTEFLDPVYLDADRDRENDNDYVNEIYQEVESSIQSGMDRLAKKRKFPVLG